MIKEKFISELLTIEESNENNFLLPKLSLYIHIPWCIQKCPYCDFNSHSIKNSIDEEQYVKHLMQDLDNDLIYVQGREIDTIFFGGGTPSILSAKTIKKIIDELTKRLHLSSNIEITLEANPGTFEMNKFFDFYQAGINRLSLGVQTFDDDTLKTLGRIHNSKDAVLAVSRIKEVGFTNFNIDLMHGLPKQDVKKALYDLQQAIDLQPTHISWYQLTIEPQTSFYYKPPALPDDDIIWSIEQAGKKLLHDHGYIQYEVSAYAKDNNFCKHNLNYWKFQDYLGIGCGASGKLTIKNKIIRTTKTKHPRGYMKGNYLNNIEIIEKKNLPFEFFMNRLRLYENCMKSEFISSTNLPLEYINDIINNNTQKGYIIDNGTYWSITSKGKLFINEILISFMID